MQQYEGSLPTAGACTIIITSGIANLMRWSGLIFPFLQRAKFNTCSFSLRSCRNNLWMKRYVLSIVKTVITLHQPRLFHGNRTEAHFLFMQRLCSDSCCQDLAQMTHQFPIHILPHQSNLHSLSPVISCRFEGCNLKHECCRFSNVCFSYSSWWLKKKIQVSEYIMRDIKYAENTSQAHSFPVYKSLIFFFSFSLHVNVWGYYF